MNQKSSAFVSKISVPGKLNDELSYVFFETLEGEHKSESTTLFGVFHSLSPSEAYHTIIKDAVKYFLDFYHKGGSAFTGAVDDDSLDPNEFLFENALQYTNEHVVQALENLEKSNDRSRFDFKKIHFILGALSDTTLYLSVTGKNVLAFYIYPVYKQKQFSHYAHITISEGQSDDDHRLFSNAISGDVSMARGTVVLCNQAFLDYITPEQIKQRLASTAPEALGQSLQNLLTKVNGKSDFSALFIHPRYSPSASYAHGTHVQTASHTSMQHLHTTQRGTDTILFPAIALSIKNGLHWLVMKVVIPLCVYLLAYFKKIQYKELFTKCMFLFRRRLKRAPGLVRRFAQLRWVSSVPDALKKIRAQVRTSNKKELFMGMCSALKRRGIILFAKARRSFMSLPIPSRALLAIGVLFTVLFVQSVVALQQSKNERERLAESQLLVRAIEQQFDTAEASLIYENEEKARGDILEAENLLAQLPKTIIRYNEEYARLITRAEQLKLKMNRVIVIQNPTVIADLSSQLPSLDRVSVQIAGAETLLATPDGLYSLDSSNGKALQIDTQAKLPSVGCLATASSLAYVCDGSGTRLFSLHLKNKNIQTMPVTFHASEKEITSAHVYNQRLYVFDKQSGSIYRHSKKGDGFEVGTDWINDKKTNLTNAIDFAIDGTVYILNNDNTILRYAAGKLNGILNPVLEPAQRLFIKVATDTESPYLYALDPSQKRIVILDKQSGNLKNQILSESFTNLKSFAVNWQKRELLVLNDSQLIRIPLDIK
ncbi:hypothetical protein HY620_02615 [Candidatus Uhrbacteria bacterium]|nr:hypothetical protein [Candidatus Uhrbacteria bacterium]